MVLATALVCMGACGVGGQVPCDISLQSNAMEEFRDAMHGLSWLVKWPTAATTECGGGAPPHCCYYGVTCCDPAMLQAGGCEQLHTVTNITLKSNNVTGELAAAVDSLRDLGCSLTTLSLVHNNLTGTVPAELATSLPGLIQVSLGVNGLGGKLPAGLSALTALEVLDLQRNQLTGGVPGDVCGPRLRDLLLGANQLSGDVDVRACATLVQLDMQNNTFNGSLPDTTNCSSLSILRVNYNNYHGRLPQHAGSSEHVSVLDVSINWLTGTIPASLVEGYPLASAIRLNDNLLTGTIPPELFLLPSLNTVALDSNALTGTIPHDIGQAMMLTYVGLSSNRLTGSIPLSMGAFAYPFVTVDLSSNSLSCCVTKRGGNQAINYSAPLLPPFLSLSKDLFVAASSSGSSGLAGMMCPQVLMAARDVSTLEPIPNRTMPAKWLLDPSYYLFKGCYCLDGYKMTTLSALNVTCTAQDTWSVMSFVSRYPWAVVIVVLVGLLLLAITLRLAMLGKGPMQIVKDVNKRVAGEPAGPGYVTIVVTDIEGYSDLMKRSPELMTRAINMHNNIMRTARWENFGYTLEQEGDAYAIAFHEACDGVRFCLQAQQMLARQHWPDGLFSRELLNDASRTKRVLHMLQGNISQKLSWLLKSPMSGKAGADSAASQRYSPQDGGLGQLSESGGASNITLAQAGMGSPGALDSGRVSSATSMFAARRGTPLWNGLRVRMGICTGHLSSGMHAAGSPIMDIAKAISDAANGGQVLMDAATFQDIKERLVELGSGGGGKTPFKLRTKEKRWWQFWRPPSSVEATVLDMGEYRWYTQKKAPVIIREESRVEENSVLGSFDASGAQVPDLLGVGEARRMSQAGAATGPGGLRTLHLYQVLAPALVERAKAFGDKLTLKEEWVMLDKPYFAAPCTSVAPIGLSFDAMGMLPNMTMAFCMVEGGKQLAMWSRKDARAVHRTISNVMRNTLRHIPGGYLCRLQDGELKYMVAFATAEEALLWSLIVQEVLLYCNYPETLLKNPSFREERDAHGQLIFRGPRLKIGICEGPPKVVVPDHLGRADYHGASINQAARYMDAAAHGGMVVCEESLAGRVMPLWQLDADDLKAQADTVSRNVSGPLQPLQSGQALEHGSSNLDASRLEGGGAAASEGRLTASSTALVSVGTAAQWQGPRMLARLLQSPARASVSGLDGDGGEGAGSRGAQSPTGAAAGRQQRGRRVSSASVAPHGSAGDDGQGNSIQEGNGYGDSGRGAPNGTDELSMGTGDGEQLVHASTGGTVDSMLEPVEPLLPPPPPNGLANGDAPHHLRSPFSTFSAKLFKDAVALVAGGATPGATVGSAPGHAALGSTTGDAVAQQPSEGPPSPSPHSSTRTAASGVLPDGAAAIAPTNKADGSFTGAPRVPSLTTPVVALDLTGRLSVAPRIPSNTSRFAPPAALLQQQQAGSAGPAGLQVIVNHTASPSPGTAVPSQLPSPTRQPLHLQLPSPTKQQAMPLLPLPPPPPQTQTQQPQQQRAASQPQVGGPPRGSPDESGPLPASIPATLVSLPNISPLLAAPSQAQSELEQQIWPISNGRLPNVSVQMSTSMRRNATAPVTPACETPFNKLGIATAALGGALVGVASATEVSPTILNARCHRIGLFKFKGNPEPIPMVHVTLGSLMGRTFPSEPPKGKGNRVAEASGIVCQVDVVAPDLVLRYKLQHSELSAPDQTLSGGSGTKPKFRSVVRMAQTIHSFTRSKAVAAGGRFQTFVSKAGIVGTQSVQQRSTNRPQVSADVPSSGGSGSGTLPGKAKSLWDTVLPEVAMQVTRSQGLSSGGGPAMPRLREDHSAIEV